MNASTPAARCPKCGQPIPPEAPQGLCPRCVMLGAATPTEEGAVPGRRPDPPDLAAVRAAFPDLEVLELIGRGGMGIVYKARQPKLDRLVALKVLQPLPGAGPEFAERFHREARVLARLSHPGIVSVHDFGQAGGFCYLLLEFVDGVNLRQAMRAGRFSAGEALALIPPVCAALQYAHAQGVLHRDIKPENILLDASGRPKIADFGIAKLVGEQPAEVTLTGSGVQLGTPHYMAPEQIERPADVDHRADIYSLGVVFYELLTGELPLGRFAAPSEKSAVNARVDDVVMRSLAKERERRQQSAGEVKSQVEGIGNPEAPAAPPPQAASQPSIPLFQIPPHRRQLATGVALVLMLVFGFDALRQFALTIGGTLTLMTSGFGGFLFGLALLGGLAGIVAWVWSRRRAVLDLIDIPVKSPTQTDTERDLRQSAEAALACITLSLAQRALLSLLGIVGAWIGMAAALPAWLWLLGFVGGIAAAVAGRRRLGEGWKRWRATSPATKSVPLPGWSVVFSRWLMAGVGLGLILLLKGSITGVLRQNLAAVLSGTALLAGTWTFRQGMRPTARWITAAVAVLTLLFAGLGFAYTPVRLETPVHPPGAMDVVRFTPDLSFLLVYVDGLLLSLGAAGMLVVLCELAAPERSGTGADASAPRRGLGVCCALAGLLTLLLTLPALGHTSGPLGLLESMHARWAAGMAMAVGFGFFLWIVAAALWWPSSRRRAQALASILVAGVLAIGLSAAPAATAPLSPMPMNELKLPLLTGILLWMDILLFATSGWVLWRDAGSGSSGSGAAGREGGLRKPVAEPGPLCQDTHMAADAPPPLPGSTPPPLPAGTPPPLPGSPARRPLRRSLLAFGGAVLVIISLFILIQTLANAFPHMVRTPQLFQDPGALLSFLAAPVAGILILAVAGTVLGWIGLAGIRKASGQRRGVTAGVVAALTWPLLLVNIFALIVPAIVITQAMAMHGSFPGPGFILAALLISVALDLFVAMAVARWAASRKKAAILAEATGQRLIRHMPMLSGIFAVLFLAGSVFIAGFTVKERVEAEQQVQMQRWNNQQPPQFQPQPQVIEDNPQVQNGARRGGIRPIPIPDSPRMQPGETLQATFNFIPEPDVAAELQATFWSNGVPVDLPGMGLKRKFETQDDRAFPTQWQLKMEADENHLTLTGPVLEGAPAGAGGSAAVLEVPSTVQLIAVPSDEGVRPKANGPARRWLFLSVDDARAGRRLNAEWGVSVDFRSRNAVAAVPLQSSQQTDVVPLETLRGQKPAPSPEEPK